MKESEVAVKHLDLFSGLGGFSLAARRVGWETVGFCEIEPYCQRVIARHWPTAPIYEDIRCLSFLGASPAKIYQSPINQPKESPGNDPDFGQSTCESFANYDLNTRSWRTSQPSLDGGYSEFSETLPRSGMMRNGTVFQHPTLAPSRTVTEYGLLPTLPASECKDFSRGEVLARLDSGGRVARRICSKSTLRHSTEVVGLNPLFAEDMSGLPIGWTELKPVEMQSTPPSQKLYSGQLKHGKEVSNG